MLDFVVSCIYYLYICKIFTKIGSYASAKLLLISCLQTSTRGHFLTTATF
jgi:hypothetical protein